MLIATALVAAWSGYNVHVVAERRHWHDWLKELPNAIIMTYDLPLRPNAPNDPDWYKAKTANISWVNCRLGDEPIYYINIVRTTATWEDRQRLVEVFPEACIVPERPEGFHP